MHITSAEFIKSARKPDHYPAPDFPEIAFAGRSNVGKSTLINALVNRKKLVKTSKTPGRTQLINFFLVNHAIYLVDLPGYGFAKVPKSVRFHWGPMIETYLLKRKTLRGVILILDIRRKPGPHEINFVAWLDQQRIPCVLVLTKTDKLSKNQQIKQRGLNCKQLSRRPEDFILFSGKTKAGTEDLWIAINGLVKPEV